jgi:anti-sigma factor RsiW
MTPPVDDFPCNRFVELVTEYLDGALPADETRRLEEHLQLCGGCESVLEQFRAIIRMTGALDEHDVDALTPAQREPVMAVFRKWAAEHPA